MATKRTKKITAVTPEAPSVESALYDVTLQETNDDGTVQETHQTMTEEEIIAETDAEQAQEIVVVTEKPSPFQEGYAAYLLGAWYGSNTYVGLSEESFEWQRGWNTAYDEDNKQK